MPVQLIWTPNTPTPAATRPRLGLEIRGDTTIGASVDGRVKLVEVRSLGQSGRGPSEATAERLIATFHGQFHRDASAQVQRRVTFEIFQASGTTTAQHNGLVHGFDPECVFGADAIVMTFVNREFVIWLPFHVDTRSEGQRLEIVAIAEHGSASSATAMARSSIYNAPILRTHGVNSTSNFGGSALSYSCPLVGHQILAHTHYIIHGGVRNVAQSTPTNIVLDPALIPVPPNGSQIPFASYNSGSLRIILLNDLLSDVVPADSFLTGNITGVTAANLATVRAGVRTRFRNMITTTLVDIFTDAGFAGMNALWQNEPAAATRVTAFTGAFTRTTLGGNFWRLSNAQNPLQTSFWNFFAGSSDQLQSAGEAEEIHGNALTQRTIGSQQVFIKNTVPIGSGNKSLEKPIQIASQVFGDLLTERSGLARTYGSVAAFNDAVDKAANKMAVLIAHEVGHSLGLMHHCRITNSGNYSETNGSPILSLMSADVDSGGFGTGLKFHSQAKVIWAAAFSVSPTFSDQLFQNKTWTANEVTTVGWSERTNRFLRAHGEGSIRRPHLSSISITSTSPPAFAGAPPNVQRGTFVPPTP